MLFQINHDFLSLNDEESISFLTRGLHGNEVSELNASNVFSFLSDTQKKEKLILIVNAMKENPHVATLDISYNQLGEEMLAWLLQALKGTSIRKIKIAFNNIKNTDEINNALKENNITDVEGLDNANETVTTLLNRWVTSFPGRTLNLESPIVDFILEKWLKTPFSFSLPTTSSETSPPIDMTAITVSLLGTISTLTEEEVREDVLQDLLQEARELFIYLEPEEVSQALYDFCLFLENTATHFLREGEAQARTGLLIPTYVTRVLSRYKKPNDNDLNAIDAIKQAVSDAMQSIVAKLPNEMINHLSHLSEEAIDEATNQCVESLLDFLSETRALFDSMAQIEGGIKYAETTLALALQQFLSRNEVNPIALEALTTTLEENKLNQAIALSTSGLFFTQTAASSSSAAQQNRSDAGTGTSREDDVQPPPAKRRKLQ